MTSRTWLITGVSSGFGRQLTQQLLDHGDRVVGTVRDTGKVTDLLERHPETFHAEVLDATDPPAVHQVVDRSFARLGRIDVAVSNAGFGLFGAAEELTDEQVDHMIATNLTGRSSSSAPPYRTCVSRAPAASSRSPPTTARSPFLVTPCATRRSGESKGSWSRSRRRSRPSASA